MLFSSIESDILKIEKDTSIHDETSFDKRTDALDLLESGIIPYLDGLLQNDAANKEVYRLKSLAEKTKTELEAIDSQLFERLRKSVSTGNCKGKAFRDLITPYFDLSKSEQQQEGYDNLDIFINRLLSSGDIPEQTKALQPEMVYYQKTPARLIFQITKQTHFTDGDVFVDIGSGLGQVAILFNLLTGIQTIGIEFEPAFCSYASNCAAFLNLPGITFINSDARKADYTAGTVFFLYTPFWGKMLQDILERLKKLSQQRKITVITYGPCTKEVALQSWLNMDAGNADNISIPAIFCSH